MICMLNSGVLSGGSFYVIEMSKFELCDFGLARPGLLIQRNNNSFSVDRPNAEHLARGSWMFTCARLVYKFKVIPRRPSARREHSSAKGGAPGVHVTPQFWRQELARELLDINTHVVDS